MKKGLPIVISDLPEPVKDHLQRMAQTASGSGFIGFSHYQTAQAYGN